MRFAILLVLLAPLCALAKLEIRNVQPAHGVLGPTRTSDDVVPLDEYLVRYQVAGIKSDKEGKADLEITATLNGPDGKAVLPPRKSPPAPRPLSLGGDVVQTFGSFTFPEKAPLGAYKLTVTVRDRNSDETASFERKITCKAPTFQIIVPRFFHDADSKVPAGTTGIVGETLHYSFKVVGYDKSQKKVALVMKATILDNDGKDIGAKPLEVKGDITDPAKAAESRQANFTGSVSLNRAGEFKLKIVVEDTIAKQTTTYEVPLKVIAP